VKEVIEAKEIIEKKDENEVKIDKPQVPFL